MFPSFPEGQSQEDWACEEKNNNINKKEIYGFIVFIFCFHRLAIGNISNNQ